MSTLFQIILLIVIIGGFCLMFWLLSKKSGKDTGQDDKIKQVHEEIEKIKNDIRDSMEKNLNFIQKQSNSTANILQKQTSDTSKIVQEVTSKLEKLEATNKQVVDFTGSLKNLEKVLSNSKNRGSLGEASLEMILQNILPPQSYEMQYHFKSGEAVDAVVKIKDKLLPIDAKFSLENYQRIIDETDKDKRIELEKSFKNDLKKRIDETAKYIRPNENTLEFAFMFIPAEGIYYDLLINEVGAVKVNTRSLIDYAFNEKKVIIVSPTTFAAYLQTVLQGLKALQIEQSAQAIRANVEKLEKHLLAYQEYHQKLGNNISTVVNSYNTSSKEFNKIEKDVIKITDGEKTFEQNLLDKPQD